MPEKFGLREKENQFPVLESSINRLAMARNHCFTKFSEKTEIFYPERAI
jgi:hypothetical protein